MKILITGGSGFIGSAVAKILIKNGHKVRLLDIHLKGGRSNKNTENIQGSVLDKYTVSEAVKGCDAVVHLAAMLGVRKTDTLKKSGLAGLFSASLELTREGLITIMQKKTFDKLLIREKKWIKKMI